MTRIARKPIANASGLPPPSFAGVPHGADAEEHGCRDDYRQVIGPLHRRLRLRDRA
jgi:hypothetical protein